MERIIGSIIILYMSLLNKLGSHLKSEICRALLFHDCYSDTTFKNCARQRKTKKRKSMKRRQPNQNTKKVKMTWLDGQK